MDIRRRMLFKKKANSSGDDASGSINISNYMTILALEDGLTASLSTNTCQYCIDGDGNWIDLPAGTTTQSINSGQTLSFKGNLTPNSSSGIGTFTINKKCNLEGNCMSLLFGDDAVNNYSLSGKNYTFYQLFYDCTTIIQVSESFLPATTLANYCYSSMFRGCTKLTTAPELPATVLTTYCYNYMFYGCTKLTDAPELPATVLANRCYSSMLRKCTSLTSAPELPATTLANYCYYYMFENCTSLISAPELPATTLTTYCYSSMFQNCTSLTSAPELPATTLASNCYNSMFRYCSKLNYIKMLTTDISASSCLSNWVYGVASTGTFVKNQAMTTLPTGASGIPSGWTIYNDEEVNTTYSIQYTSSDGNIVTPYKTNAFGANIVSNNYINGQGIISFDGPLITIGESAFESCTSLTSITIPDSVTTIENWVFYECRNLTNVTIPDSVTTIGRAVFYNCDSLTSVTIPGSVTTLEFGSFRDCDNLTSVTIGDGIITIGENAFYSCDSLTSVNIPDSVTTIGNSAFYGCTNMTSVYCKATTPPSLGVGVFEYGSVSGDRPYGCDIYVPTESVEAYKSATRWSEYANTIVGYNF